MIHAHSWCYDIVRRAVTDGHEAFERLWRDGGRQRADRTHQWLAAHRPEIEESLGAIAPRQAI